MADTKISALTDVVALAAGDKVPVADASDLTVGKSATMTEINVIIRATAPTLPTAAGTALQHVKSDGTNLILTTETYDAPSTAGNILVSDGTNWKAKPNPAAIFNSPAQSPAVTDTYITNSGILIPASGLHRIGMRFDWMMDISKTAAGSTAAVWNIRLGTLGTTSDASILAITDTTQSAAVDSMIQFWTAVIVITGATGKLFIYSGRQHIAAAAAGFLASQGRANLTSAINLTTANLILGISVASGTSAVWTIQNILTQITY